MPSPRNELAEVRRSADRSSTTWCGWSSTTGPSRATCRPAPSPTSRSCRSSRSWRSRFVVVGALSQVFPGRARTRSPRRWSRCSPASSGPTRASSRRTPSSRSGTGLVLVVSLLGLLYAGLGWLSAMRDALIVMFEDAGARAAQLRRRQAARPGQPGGHRRHPGAERGGRRVRQRLRRRHPRLGRARRGAGAAAAAASPWCSASPPTSCCSSSSSSCWPSPTRPPRSLWSGALLGAIGFEVLKRLSFLLLGATQELARVPGLRHRADPARLDLLLLPRRHVRRGVGPHRARGPRAARARGPLRRPHGLRR